MRHLLLALLLCLSPALHADDKVPNPRAAIEDAGEAMDALQAANDAWGMRDATRFLFDLERGTIRFQLADGRTATAPMQIIGTYNPKDGTFLWGWDHPSVPAELAVAAKRLRAWGEANGVEEMTRRLGPMSEARAWEYTSLAAVLTDAKGVYRPDMEDGPYVFITFGEVTFADAPDDPDAKATK